jgi:hypothetical protein
MTHLSALGFPDRQRANVGVVVADLEPAEFAVPAAGEQRPTARAWWTSEQRLAAGLCANLR